MTANTEIQTAVAREAGASFESVVKSYADAGHSMTDTATLLGYSSPEAFRRLCLRQCWRHWFAYKHNAIRAQQEKRERRGIDPDFLKRARQKIQYPTVEYQGIQDTYAGHARRLGLSIHTVRKRAKRQPDDLDYIFSLRSHRYRPEMPNHPWKRLQREAAEMARAE